MLSTENIFANTPPEKVLKKNLYDFRNRAGDDEFHFLVGACMLQLGFLNEAYLAFSKARMLQGNASLKSQLFLCIALMNAERYAQCAEELKRIEWTRLDSGQLYVYIDLAERSGVSEKNIVKYFECKFKESENTKDKIVYILRAIKYNPELADEKLFALSHGDFNSIDDYFSFIDECHTAGLASRKIIDLLSKVPITKMNLFSLTKTMVSTKVFLEMSKKERDEWLQRALSHLSEQEGGLRSRVWSVYYEAEEYYDNEERMKKAMDNLCALYDAGAREETAMMTIAAYFLKHFNSESIERAQKILSELVESDRDNMLYRKYLYELMTKSGCYSEAERLNIDSIEVRTRKEKEINDLLAAFHQFYGSEKCPLETQEKCPLCFGSEERPQFKVVCANVSPRQIFAKNIVSNTISIHDEHIMKEMFDWQPMHVASPIIGEYLKGLGAYPTKRGFPDVLVEGETYVFIRYKKEALRRLIDEGYSLNQIDPMFSVLYPISKPKELDGVSKEDKSGGYDGIVSAGDFVIEIVRAISPQIQKSQNSAQK